MERVQVLLWRGRWGSQEDHAGAVTCAVAKSTADSEQTLEGMKGLVL